ncbi:glycoside hydrolase family 9 protein [Dyadobacter chenhuakuii]|uniref:Endoglucanase n=1 Tax=Dyadobacter chenhuakuii TaxID=2909339 RepID=A0ABY4XSV8_9BACT|nr:glycoside hydrolase family 9 protein [Dyadobacter chenhuakuii]MCF2492502.1 glycoside hydrolase family 9 protein [Dyadobacter chenhuakuii]USJ33200.1 glycoside hydrolase family 9 protein [Dyadobacter chenhuakuii]
MQPFPLFKYQIALVFICSIIGLALPASGQNVPDPVRLNQVGFYPDAEKIAVVLGEKQTAFQLKDVATGKTVFKGKLSEPRTNQHSGKMSRIANFSSVRKPGKYVLEVPSLGKSAPFEIKDHIYKDVAAASLKGFYYQRASVELPEKFAGKWARPAGHPDDKVLIHASAVSEGRAENAVISSGRGWYDAGDYNKYIVNSGITMGTLLSLYEDYPSFCENFITNIPESNNGVPDLLDEALYNLRWMLTMQDPADGGVYHKLTNPRFDGMVMPDACKNPRYVVQKGTAATLDFVAVMAQSGRIFKNFENKFPGLSDSCVTAAVKGWEWAKKNPAVLYNQDEMNKKFDPDVVTGAYGDRNVNDEWIWAAAEMYALTKKSDYLKDIAFQADQPMPLPTWSQVKTLGYYTMIRFADELKTDLALTKSLKTNITSFADNLLQDLEKQSYHTVMGKTAKDYAWGSSSVAANQGIALLYAFKLTKNPKYALAAQENLDYLLGRNATGYSFLTGFGSKRVMHPHHRLSVADGVVDPVPGLLSGGPNPAQQDKCTTYTSKFADESFTDDDCSYASNEIAINWNAPMVYLAAALEALSEMK